jgi:16S rRNA (guanine527-N7)-methyltransferase
VSIIAKYCQVSEAELASFERLYELTMASPINITAIKSKEDYELKHVLDSLYVFRNALFAELNPANIATVADVGSGGGFPGLIMAICYPQWQVTLIESIAKKCNYLESAVSALGLTNVSVINARAEKVQGSFDLVTARGVGSVKDVYNSTKHIVKIGWMMYKGERLCQEQEEFASVVVKRRLKSVSKRVESPFTRSYLYMYY